jgi:hypothetical protein
VRFVDIGVTKDLSAASNPWRAAKQVISVFEKTHFVLPGSLVNGYWALFSHPITLLCHTGGWLNVVANRLHIASEPLDGCVARVMADRYLRLTSAAALDIVHLRHDLDDMHAFAE